MSEAQGPDIYRSASSSSTFGTKPDVAERSTTTSTNALSDDTAQRPAAKASGSTPARAASAAETTSVTKTTSSTPVARPVHRTRKARLRLSRIDPWSVMKTAVMFGVAGGIIFFVSVWVVWSVIGASGVFESVNTAVNDLLATPGSPNKFSLENYLNTSKVLGVSAMIAVADVVIFTALATLFSFLYNLSATALGGLEVTLAED